MDEHLYVVSSDAGHSTLIAPTDKFPDGCERSETEPENIAANEKAPARPRIAHGGDVMEIPVQALVVSTEYGD